MIYQKIILKTTNNFTKKNQLLPFQCKICKRRTFHSFNSYQNHTRIHKWCTIKSQQHRTRQGFNRTPKNLLKDAKKLTSLKSEVISKLSGKDNEYLLAPKPDGNDNAHFESINFKCSKCHCTFATAEAFEQHALDVHPGIKLHPCSHCSEVFKDNTLLQIHVARNHKAPAPSHQCPHCYKTFRLEVSLRKHQTLHQGKKRMRPPIQRTPSCNEKKATEATRTPLSTDASLVLNKIIVDKVLDVNPKTGENAAKNDKIPCVVPRTGKDASMNNKLSGANSKTENSASKSNKLQDTNHRAGESGSRTSTIIQCTQCSRNFKDTISLAAHVCHQTNDDQQYKCPPCAKIFPDLTKLLEHVLKRKPHVNILSCPQCGKTYGRKENLRQHLITHYQPLKCSICDKTFLRPSSLKSHMTRHEGLHKCPICSRHCGSESELSVHVRKHSDMKVFKCRTCDKGVKSKESLLTHRCSSTDRSEYKERLRLKRLSREKNPVKLKQCSLCDESFKESELITHKRRVHWGARFSCSECDKTYMVERSLQQHIANIHYNNKPFVCGTCGKGFQERGLLVTHELIHSGGKPHECPTCKQCFRMKRTLIVHIQAKHTNIRPHVCSVCGKGFVDSYSLKIHLGSHRNERSHICDRCGKGFAQKQSLIGHLRLHTGAMPFQCSECGLCFRTRLKQQLHFKVEHVKDNPNVCQECGKLFPTGSHLKYHMKSHTKPFNCKICGKSFPHKASVTKHEKSVHALDENPHMCDHCGKSFSRKQTLIEHLRIHSGEMPFQCTECDRCFRTQFQQKCHFNLEHMKDNPNVCQECGKLFPTGSHLKYHMKSHKKLSNCKISGKSFPHKSSVTKHKKTVHDLKIHRNGNPLKCDHCGKQFSRKGNLIEHLRIHSGEMPFQCVECDRCFRTQFQQKCHFNLEHMKDNPNVCQVCGKLLATPSRLNSHMRHHTKPFKCKFCGKGFSQNTHVLAHEKTVHAEERDTSITKSKHTKGERKESSQEKHTIVEGSDHKKSTHTIVVEGTDHDQHKHTIVEGTGHDQSKLTFEEGTDQNHCKYVNFEGTDHDKGKHIAVEEVLNTWGEFSSCSIMALLQWLGTTEIMWRHVCLFFLFFFFFFARLIWEEDACLKRQKQTNKKINIFWHNLMTHPQIRPNPRHLFFSVWKRCSWKIENFHKIGVKTSELHIL